MKESPTFTYLLLLSLLSLLLLNYVIAAITKDIYFLPSKTNKIKSIDESWWPACMTVD